MATVCEHLSVGELEARYLEFQNVTASRHFQVIWLVARGHTISQVPETAAYGERWIEQLLARYNTEGPEAPGDLRQRNGAPATILKPDLLAKLRQSRSSRQTHRIGLKPVTRRVWAPIGERPIAHGHHRFDWLYVTAFVPPAAGETFWYVSNGAARNFSRLCSKPLHAKPGRA
jgi:Winged helix-turn helix